ncbi:hypothetical protein V9L05_15225 [Bernardetia sp. Wsw4-3y2]|uniref:hypothetical protein n=1 Tax=Bernardetia sp. Wsw4-3y2 TaxID=3127471 RepID=UPI0030D3FF2B
MAEEKDKKVERVDKIAELEAKLKEAQEQNAAILERNEDLKRREKLALESTITKKVIVEIEEQKYEVLAGCMIGGLKDKRELTKEELGELENLKVVQELIKKGSGLIRPI